MKNQRGYVHCPLDLRLNSVPDSCSESRMLRMEAILSAVAGLTVSWSSIFSKEPSSFTSRSITTENHKRTYSHYVCRMSVIFFGVEHRDVFMGKPICRLLTWLKCLCIKYQLNTCRQGQARKTGSSRGGMKAVWNSAYRLLQQLTGRRYLTS